MKKILFSLVGIAALILTGTCSMAAVQTFQTKVGNFSIDVPDGWKSKAISDGCQLDSGDGKNSMSVQFIPPSQESAEAVAKRVSKAIQLKVTNEKVEDKAAVIQGTLQGTPMTILVVKDHLFNAAIFGGPDQDKMIAIYGTIKSASKLEQTFDLEAGPIWNNDHAKERCSEVIAEWLQAHPGKQAEWTGEWKTVKQGEMSTCGVRVLN